MPFIDMTRIYPPPRWPMIHKAVKAFRAGGREELNTWAKTLSPQETETLAEELLDLLSEASGKSIEEVYQAILKGGPPL